MICCIIIHYSQLKLVITIYAVGERGQDGATGLPGAPGISGRPGDKGRILINSDLVKLLTRDMKLLT